METIDINFLEKLNVEPEWVCDKLIYIDGGKSKALEKYQNLQFDGFVIWYKDRGYITFGVLYDSSSKTKYCNNNIMISDMLESPNSDCKEYKLVETVTTEYGTKINVYHLDVAMQKEIQKELQLKYKDGWISIKDSIPKHGETVVVMLEDGTITYSEEPSRLGYWEFFGIVKWRYK